MGGGGLPEGPRKSLTWTGFVTLECRARGQSGSPVTSVQSDRRRSVLPPQKRCSPRAHWDRPGPEQTPSRNVCLSQVSWSHTCHLFLSTCSVSGPDGCCMCHLHSAPLHSKATEAPRGSLPGRAGTAPTPRHPVPVLPRAQGRGAGLDSSSTSLKGPDSPGGWRSERESQRQDTKPPHPTLRTGPEHVVALRPNSEVGQQAASGSLSTECSSPRPQLRDQPAPTT